MELQFQQQQRQAECQAKGRRRSSSKCKFVGVRQRPSGRWVAEIKDTTAHKIRVWLGTFETAEDAARAYDEAACLLRGSNTRTNFAAAVSPSPLTSRIRTLLTHKKLKKHTAPPQLSMAHGYGHAGPIVADAAGSSTSSSSSISFPMSSSNQQQRVADKSYMAYQLIDRFDQQPWTAALGASVSPSPPAMLMAQ